MSSTHESYTREETVKVGSERSFGLTIAAVLLLLSSFNWWHAGRSWPWLTGIAAFLMTAALVHPPALKGLNQLWFKFGMLLHKVVNPVVMGLLFYGAVLPTGLVMRAMGKDLLRLKREPEAGTYWIRRVPAGPSPESMKDQF
jgi:hypothetical protein